MMAAAQQLAPADRGRLDEHLAACEQCRDFYKDMVLLAGVLATDQPDLSEAADRAKVLALVPSGNPSAQGTDNKAAPVSKGNRTLSRGHWIAIAASLACFACGLVSARFLMERNRESARPYASVTPASPALMIQKEVSSSVPDVNPSHTDKEEALRGDLNRLQAQYQVVQAELAQLRQQDEKSAKINQERDTELSKLRMENTTQLALISQIQLQLDHAHNIHAQDEKLIALRDDQVRQLTTNVAVSSSEAVEKREIREAASLMGQRNLHVVDVYDNNTKGQRTPSFGRVFYSEGGPMMFVAFDLPNHGAGDKTTYHAWGQMEGSSKNPLQLGTFTQDDAASKRWVMRVSDIHLLKQIDAVFITADRGPEVHAPNGLPLLYAYLRQLPNHP